MKISSKIRSTPSNTVVTRRSFAALLAAIPLGVLIEGCSGTRGSGANQPDRLSTGRARVTVRWPERSRLIPLAANSILVKMTLPSGDGPARVVARQIIPRPENGGVTTITLDDLPVYQLYATATAHPNADGTGVAQAWGTTLVSIYPDEITPFTITMGSTIDRLVVEPTSVSVQQGLSRTVVATAISSLDSGIVLTRPLVWTSANPAVATVDNAGVVSGVRAGTTQVTVTETESGRSTTFTATVTDPPATRATTFHINAKRDGAVRFEQPVVFPSGPA